MSTAINSRSYLEKPSPTSSPDDYEASHWSLPFSPITAPSVAQLAQSRAQVLDFATIHNNASFDSRYSKESGLEKQQYETKASSPNGSQASIPPLHSIQPEASDRRSMSCKSEIAFIFITCIAQFLSLSALNQTVAPVMVLADYFHIDDYGTLSWFSASFSMSVGTFILPAGRLGDMYGHKRIYLIGWIWFAVWSLITGFSYTSGVVFFSICRAFQGIGPALLVPNAVALIGRTLPVGQKRNVAFACFGACGPLGAATGAVFAALLADLAWWPWTFRILAIVCLFATVGTYVILPDVPDETFAAVASVNTNVSQRPQFDYWGTITGVSGLVLINFALNQAPLVTWANPYIGTLLSVGCLFMVAFVLVELYATDYPLVPLRGLHRDAVFALTCIAAGWGSHGIWAYYLYLFLEHLRGHSALLTSAETAPAAITGVLFAFSTVWLLKRVSVSYVMFIAMTFFMVGSLLLATMPIHQTYWAQTFISVLIMPGAMNLSYPAANILMSSALPKEKQGIAASLVSTMVNYSISCGLGFAGTIDRYVITAEAQRRGRTDGNPVPLADVSHETQSIRLKGLRGAYWLAVALGGLGMFVAFIHILHSRRRAGRAS